MQVSQEGKRTWSGRKRTVMLPTQEGKKEREEEEKEEDEGDWEVDSHLGSLRPWEWSY